MVKRQSLVMTLMHTSSSDRLDNGSAPRLVLSSHVLLTASGLLEALLTAAGSLGGGGRGERILLDPPGGGARPMAFGFPLTECAAESPTDESIPVPLDGLCFTFMCIVSPS